MGAMAHIGESLLAALRDAKITVTSELISGLLALVDGLRAILRLIEATGTEGERSTDDDRDLIELLTRLNTGSGESAECGKTTSPCFAVEDHRQIGQLVIETRAITGAEALIRWTHPTRGSVPPAQFIPVAEDSVSFCRSVTGFCEKHVRKPEHGSTRGCLQSRWL